MTIDGTNIKTSYGLIVTNINGYVDKPKLKDILPERVFTSTDDIKHEELQITIELYGEYTTQALLATKLNNFRTLIESDLAHAFAEAKRGLYFNGVCKNGVDVTVFKKTAVVKFKASVIV